MTSQPASSFPAMASHGNPAGLAAHGWLTEEQLHRLEVAALGPAHAAGHARERRLQREGAASSRCVSRNRASGSPDLVITNAVIVDVTGIRKADVGIALGVVAVEDGVLEEFAGALQVLWN